MKVIFLDIDGVLNSEEHFIENHIDTIIYFKAYKNNEYIHDLEDIVKPNLFDINFEKLQLLKKIIRETDSKIVVSSAWRLMRKWPLIEDYLISKGLPIIGTTPYILGKRGEEIRTYLKEHKEIDNFIILDDERFRDFNEQLNYLIKTDFCNGGLTEEHADEAINLLNNMKVKKYTKSNY